MITENIPTFKIHKLTQAQYDRELEAGNIDENALYLTPDNITEIYDADAWVYGCYKRTPQESTISDMYGNQEEWINPPLHSQILYPTFERFGGCPVYEMTYFDFSTQLPGYGRITIPVTFYTQNDTFDLSVLSLIEIKGTIAYITDDDYIYYSPITNEISIRYDNASVTIINNTDQTLEPYFTLRFMDTR